MSLTINATYRHGRVVGIMVNYGFGMPTRLVADGNVARWCGRLVAHYGGTKALVVLGGDKHTRDELVSAALGSLDRALLERVLFRCGSVGGDGGDELVDEAVALATDEGVDFVLAIGDADTAGCTYCITPSYAAAHTLPSSSRKGEPMPSNSSGAMMAKTGTSPAPTTAGTLPSETMHP